MPELETKTLPDFIEELKIVLTSHSVLIDAKQSLHLLFTRTAYGCERNYPVAIVHEESRIKDADALAYFKENYLLDEDGLSFEEYPQDDLNHIYAHAPKYLQTVGFMLTSTKELPHPTFSNKFKHDYWKKIQSVEGLEAVIDISALTPTSSACEAEDALRAIIRKRKEVHQLKKISFIWIVEVIGENKNVSTVMRHYFEEDTIILKNGRKTFYVGWSTPLQSINMRYFVCPPA